MVEVPGLPHGRIARAIASQVAVYDAAHPDAIDYHAAGSDCALRLPGMRSERHPDLTIYLTPAPDPVAPWDRWVPDIVVEVVSESSRDRDYATTRREYLAAGVREYWIVDPEQRAVLALVRSGDVFTERRVTDVHETSLLPGFRLDVAALFAA